MNGEKGHSRKIVLLLGAGATVADVSNRFQKNRPPVDKGFFRIARSVETGMVFPIAGYLKKVYGIDIYDIEHDSLEKIMAMLFTDLFNPILSYEATQAFRALIYLFNKRLAVTTNNIEPTSKRYLYRLIIHYLNKKIKPNDITIITFNQDLQIEKILHKLSLKRKPVDILNFPSCYKIDFDTITSPTESGVNLFENKPASEGGIAVLKLHGSLNWYSTHTSPDVSRRTIFNPKRPINLTRRQAINPSMTRKGGRRYQYTLPIIVPPVTHKSAILPERVRKLWTLGENALKEANEILIFGYSCPALDFESSNLIQRTLKGNEKIKRISIIDPDPNVLKRYVELIQPKQICYYPDADNFFRECKECTKIT